MTFEDLFDEFLTDIPHFLRPTGAELAEMRIVWKAAWDARGKVDAEIVRKENDRILSRQTHKESDYQTDTQIRMCAMVLPDIIKAIERG